MTYGIHDARSGNGKMAEDSGWIKLHRALLDGPIIQHAGVLQVWIYCLLRANWEPRKIMFPGCLEPITIDRGEFVTGRNSLHAALYPDNNKDAPVSRTVWRWLETLQSMKCVGLRTVSNRCTVVTVLNYKAYQEVKPGQCPADVQPVSSPCPAGVPPVSTNKELNNLRIEEGMPPTPVSDFAFLQGCNQAHLEIVHHETGLPISYPDDPMVWQWLFIRKWNELPEVSRHGANDLSSYSTAELLKRFQEPDWDWKTAMMAFPINYEKMSLVTFLEKGTVQKINDGGWKIPQFVKDRQHGKSLRGGAGVNYDPDAAAKDPTYGKF